MFEPLRILTGQTASGKSGVAICLAAATDAEIISVDSMKVYRGLDIGTAKPPRAARERVRFHMMDIVAPHETFTLARFLAAAQRAAAVIAQRGRTALYAGGTPLYLRGLLYGIFDGPAADWSLRAALLDRAREEGLEAALHAALAQVDPVTADRLHPNDLVRVVRALEVAQKTGRPISEHQREYPARGPRVRYRMVGLRRGEADLRARIARRTERMFAEGLVAEVEGLLDRDGLCGPAEKAIGYREVLGYLRGEMTLEETEEKVKRHTWRLARKQMTWLRSFPEVAWLDIRPEEAVEETAERARKPLFGSGTMN